MKNKKLEKMISKLSREKIKIVDGRSYGQEIGEGLKCKYLGIVPSIYGKGSNEYKRVHRFIIGNITNGEIAEITRIDLAKDNLLIENELIISNNETNYPTKVYFSSPKFNEQITPQEFAGLNLFKMFKGILEDENSEMNQKKENEMFAKDLKYLAKEVFGGVKK